MQKIIPSKCQYEDVTLSDDKPAKPIFSSPPVKVCLAAWSFTSDVHKRLFRIQRKRNKMKLAPLKASHNLLFG